MSERGAHGTVHRVVVAIDDAPAASSAVEAAVQLASALDARLTALFLENADLIRAAALPFVDETGAVSGTVRPMAGTAMMRALRSSAEEARAAVATAAEASGLVWQFEVVRGRRLAVISAMREALDLLVLAQTPGHLTADLLSARPARDAAAETAPVAVAVAVRDVPSAGRALQAAQALADVCDGPLLFLLCGGHGVERIRRLRELTEQGLGGKPLRARYVTLQSWNTQAIASTARQHGARLLVWCDGDLRRDAQRLDALLTRLRCPLVVAD
jgi:nucleotide-binding universal stress UspA family protein